MTDRPIKKLIQRGVTDKDTRTLLLQLVDDGVKMKRTRKGFLIYGPTGTASAHTTPSDVRSRANLRASLRRAGLDV